MKKIFLSIAIIFACVLIALAANYTVSGMSFNGYMVGPGDTDWLTLQGQEGTNPNICLSHQPGVDFDIEIYNDGQLVCRNDGLETYSCCKAYTPGRVQVKVWSHSGSGNYTVIIHR